MKIKSSTMCTRARQLLVSSCLRGHVGIASLSEIRVRRSRERLSSSSAVRESKIESSYVDLWRNYRTEPSISCWYFLGKICSSYGSICVPWYVGLIIFSAAGFTRPGDLMEASFVRRMRDGSLKQAVCRWLMNHTRHLASLITLRSFSVLI